MQNGPLLLLLPLLGSFLLGGLLAAAAVFAWLRSHIKRERQRVHNVEQARQLATQQLTQARKQVEQLQRESHELRLAVRPASRATPVAETPADIARRLAALLPEPEESEDSDKGFKDTEILRRSGD